MRGPGGPAGLQNRFAALRKAVAVRFPRIPHFGGEGREMTDAAAALYNDLADRYHLIFGDWDRALRWQGEVLERLIRAEMGPGPLSVLDCSAGIGTQSIGLALRGYRVHATDLSGKAIERARREAARFGVSMTFGVADFRSLGEQVAGAFDVVISCDNALPHLRSDEDLLLAARNIRSKLRDEGLFLASIRDYDEVLRERPNATMPTVFDTPEGRRVYFQVWDWADDGRAYTVHLFLVDESGSAWETYHHETRYRAVLREELAEILRQAGLRDVAWQMPETSGYYQPVVKARRG
jgi:glycine/sarcosine N-methyltransferase